MAVAPARRGLPCTDSRSRRWPCVVRADADALGRGVGAQARPSPDACVRLMLVPSGTELRVSATVKDDRCLQLIARGGMA